MLHGPRKNNKEKRVSLPFLKKYIHLARQVKPTLTDEAGRIISEEYPRLRSFDSEHSDMARVRDPSLPILIPFPKKYLLESDLSFPGFNRWLHEKRRERFKVFKRALSRP